MPNCRGNSYLVGIFNFLFSKKIFPIPQIGLAVGDIASMQHNAHLKRLAMQVELHTDLEQKLPARILRAGERDKYTVYMHTAKYFITGVGKNDILRVKFVVA